MSPPWRAAGPSLPASTTPPPPPARTSPSRPAGSPRSPSATTGSRFRDHITPASLGVSGHSMGGGAAVLAAARNPKIKAVSTYAAAETNPSAKAAAATLAAPAQFLAGSQDTITPVGDHQQPMFTATPPSKQLRTITGGLHCGFMDSSGLFCDNGSITRAARLTASKRVMTSWFRHY